MELSFLGGMVIGSILGARFIEWIVASDWSKENNLPLYLIQRAERMTLKREQRKERKNHA